MTSMLELGVLNPKLILDTILPQYMHYVKYQRTAILKVITGTTLKPISGVTFFQTTGPKPLIQES